MDLSVARTRQIVAAIVFRKTTEWEAQDARTEWMVQNIVRGLANTAASAKAASAVFKIANDLRMRPVDDTQIHDNDPRIGPRTSNGVKRKDIVSSHETGRAVVAEAAEVTRESGAPMSDEEFQALIGGDPVERALSRNGTGSAERFISRTRPRS
jgi:hypothetical protein